MGVAVAHQISQPLSNVAMYLHVGRQLLATKPDETKPVLDALENATGQLRLAKEILERLRDFVSRGTLQPALTDLNILTRKIVALAKDDARAHNVSVRFEDSPVPLIVVDPLQLEQILINLISNAIDAAGEARQGFGSVTLRLGSTASRVWINIEDNGPGLAEDVASNVFEPFVTTKPEGMGLGLALSKELVTAHGGTIWWERMAQGGTRFVVELPTEPETGHGQ
jgi:two-component system sensor kinase FixL